MPIAVVILNARVEFFEQPFVKPLIISSGAITHPRLAALFEPRDGKHQLPDPLPPGLGSSL